jgi:hypothetical protein
MWNETTIYNKADALVAASRVWSRPQNMPRSRGEGERIPSVASAYNGAPVHSGAALLVKNILGLILSTWLLQNGTGRARNGHFSSAALYF